MSRLHAFGWTRLATLAAILAVAIYRISPHLPNFTPVGAMFVLGGLYLGRNLAWMAAPFAGLLASDVVLNLAYDGRPIHPERLVDYAAFALVGLIARWAAARPLGWRIATVVAAPVVFFLISNFGVWAGGGSLPGEPAYAHTLSGLAQCYAAALPFFRGTAIGDWLFAGAGLLALEGLRRRETRRGEAFA
ncbi:MAG TPA: DUF6580 family putative transport protein [Phenylobacterium sp.]|nr:DUF6580 family putative transport protein [Phenylobacterium sp.]